MQRCKALRVTDKVVDCTACARAYAGMAQILAVDYGTKRVGVAVSDARCTFALPLETLEVHKRQRAASVADLAKERKVRIIVIGRPTRKAGEDSALWPEIEEFGRSLSRRGYEVVYEDEAFSSAEAESRLAETVPDRLKNSRPADAVAASIILQQYLDRQGGDGPG